MLIKPDLKDEQIIACLRDAYGLTVEKIAFLPVGADFKEVVVGFGGPVLLGQTGDISDHSNDNAAEPGSDGGSVMLVSGL